MDRGNVTDSWDNRGDIVIGNDVWIGYEAVILAGVTVGDGSVIGAGSVVTKDVPGGVVAAGNPCRVLREIGERYNVTRERVRQLEARLLQKLKTHLSTDIQDFSEDWISH